MTIPLKYMLNGYFSKSYSKKIGILIWYKLDWFWTVASLDNNLYIDSEGVLQLDFFHKFRLKSITLVTYIHVLVTHLRIQKHCCDTSFHEYWYTNVMRSSRLFMGSFWKTVPYSSGDVSTSYLTSFRSNYCCRRHTMHANMVFLWIVFCPRHNN